MELTQQYLKEALDYNPETGIFTWKIRPIEHFKSVRSMKIFNTSFSGKNAGCVTKNNYLIIGINKNLIMAHRLAWFYINGVMPENDIDHINGIRTDNRICNLREATRGQNMQNLKKAHKDNASGLIGAFFNKKQNSFYSHIMVNGKIRCLGYFKTAAEAHEAYLQEKRNLHPFGTL